MSVRFIGESYPAVKRKGEKKRGKEKGKRKGDAALFVPKTFAICCNR
jgi:hypothetical protein